MHRLVRPTAALVLDDVVAGYGAHTVLRGVHLEVDRGELVGVVGPSGCGKTTLLRVLSGAADLHHGRVEVLGAPVHAERAPGGLGYVPQLESVERDVPLTVEQVVLLGDVDASRWPWFSRAERHAARSVLDRLGLAGLAGSPVESLSGGQRQRMFVARALHRRCELLLLDEPTSGVDLGSRREMLALLGELNAEGLTILVTTHDLNFVAAHLPRIVCLSAEGGQLVADGPPREALTSEVLERTFGAPMRVVDLGGRVVVVDEPLSLVGEVAP